MAKLSESMRMIDANWLRARAVGMSVRVWRLVAGAPEGLFTYAGGADVVVARAVLQQVRRLTAAVPGEWRVDVIGAGFDAALLTAVEEGLGDLRRCGVCPRLALAPRLRLDLKVALAPLALAAMVVEPPTVH